MPLPQHTIPLDTGAEDEAPTLIPQPSPHPLRPMPPPSTQSGAPSAAATRSTVLPRVEDGQGGARLLPPENKPRYELVKTLGAGAMGEVVLVRDQDIVRPAAIKRLLPQVNHPAGLARFVDE